MVNFVPLIWYITRFLILELNVKCPQSMNYLPLMLSYECVFIKTQGIRKLIFIIKTQ